MFKMLIFLAAILGFSSCLWRSNTLDVASEAIKYLIEDNGKTKSEVQDIISSYGKIQKIELTNKQVSNIVGYSTIPAKNCVGKNTITINETFTKSITTEYNIGGNAQLEASAISLVSLGLGVQFGVTKGSIVERSLSFEVAASPNTNTEYKIAWKEIWQSGIVTLENKTGEIELIPFEIKSGIEYQVYEIKEHNCI